MIRLPTRCLWLFAVTLSAACIPSTRAPAAIDERVRGAMTDTRANGMAIAVIDDGRVKYVQAYGARNAKGEPLPNRHRHVRRLAHENCDGVHDAHARGPGQARSRCAARRLPRASADQLRRRQGAPGEVRAVSRPRRRRAVAQNHGPHGADPLHGFSQLLVHRARPEAAHPFRSRLALQLFG